MSLVYHAGGEIVRWKNDPGKGVWICHLCHRSDTGLSYGKDTSKICKEMGWALYKLDKPRPDGVWKNSADICHLASHF